MLLSCEAPQDTELLTGQTNAKKCAGYVETCYDRLETSHTAASNGGDLAGSEARLQHAARSACQSGHGTPYKCSEYDELALQLHPQLAGTFDHILKICYDYIGIQRLQQTWQLTRVHQAVTTHPESSPSAQRRPSCRHSLGSAALAPDTACGPAQHSSVPASYSLPRATRYSAGSGSPHGQASRQ